MSTSENETQALRRRSGEVCVNSRLVSFLYQLMRDHLPPGVVENLVWDCENPEALFTNGYLANYAIDVARRLGDSPIVRQQKAREAEEKRG